MNRNNKSQRVAIIGCGVIGLALARQFARCKKINYEVTGIEKHKQIGNLCWKA